MAFEMYADKRHEQVEHYEEFMFQPIIGKHKDFPRLNQLWQDFYRSPKIKPNVSNELVHELLQLKDTVCDTEDSKWLEPIVVRLSAFFSYAYRNSITVTCSSD